MGCTDVLAYDWYLAGLVRDLNFQVIKINADNQEKIYVPDTIYL